MDSIVCNIECSFLILSSSYKCNRHFFLAKDDINHVEKHCLLRISSAINQMNYRNLKSIPTCFIGLCITYKSKANSIRNIIFVQYISNQKRDDYAYFFVKEFGKEGGPLSR